MLERDENGRIPIGGLITVVMLALCAACVLLWEVEPWGPLDFLSRIFAGGALVGLALWSWSTLAHWYRHREDPMP